MTDDLTPEIQGASGAVARGAMEIGFARFAYSDLPAPIAAEVRDATARIKNRLACQVNDMIETGNDLIGVKSKTEHGQFKHWLDSELNMNIRTAQRFMRAAEWAEGKHDTVSHLPPTMIYLLSAPSTPESIQRQVFDDLEAGNPINHHEVRDAVAEVKSQERQEKTAEQRKKDLKLKKRSQARWERERRKEAEEQQRRDAAGKAVAREVADILSNKLSKDEIKIVYDALGNFDVNRLMLREAISMGLAPSHRVGLIESLMTR